LKIGSLESEKIIIGSLESEKIGSPKIHIGYLTFSLKKTAFDCKKNVLNLTQVTKTTTNFVSHLSIVPMLTIFHCISSTDAEQSVISSAQAWWKNQRKLCKYVV